MSPQMINQVIEELYLKNYICFPHHKCFRTALLEIETYIKAETWKS